MTGQADISGKAPGPAGQGPGRGRAVNRLRTIKAVLAAALG